MKKKWIGIGAALLAMFCFYGWPGQGALAQSPKQKATVGVNVLNVREGPSLEKPVVAQITDGDTFTVLDERYGWLKIPLSGGRTGWVAG
ncbi:MAG TPA: SH3 domain-containing protein, partial [Bacillales bacterium]|nr:SH3 domain-containing protein [Bacillales bacterium]